ncbi:MAG: TlpA disulfide reductase family protein [Bacteroidota bacterium]
MKIDKVVLLIAAAAVLFFVGRKLYFNPDIIQGDKAPNFTASTLANEAISLADLKGNYVLLDFWGSWCGPCRKESPELVKLYQKFHGQSFQDAENFEILSVGIEKDKNRWLDAIERDGLDWQYHVSDLKEFENEIAQLYGVRAIPSKFLINPDGLVIGVNQSLAQVDAILSDKLKATREMSALEAE